MPKSQKEAKTTSKKNSTTTPKTTPKTLILLDSHAILHRAYHALPDFTSSKGEPTDALYGVVALLLKVLTVLHLRENG